MCRTLWLLKPDAVTLPVRDGILSRRFPGAGDDCSVSIDMSLSSDPWEMRGGRIPAVWSGTQVEPSTGRSVLDELMTARQVALILQMKVSTVEDYARRGVLPSVKVGRHRRFIRSQLEQALGALTNGQA